MDLSEVYSASVRHPWETTRGRFFAHLLKPVLKKEMSVLDVGSGDAFFANYLLKQYPGLEKMVCYDQAYDDKSFESSQKISFVNKAPKGQFDIILLLDVLEHVEHDSVFLQQLINDHLKPGGYLLISVPAWQKLYNSHDKALKHYRRYNPSNIQSLLSRMKIRKKGGLFSSLLLFRYLETCFKRKKTAALEDVTTWPRWRRWLVSAILHLDALLSLGFSFFKIDYLGLSWWALCQKQ